MTYIFRKLAAILSFGVFAVAFCLAGTFPAFAAGGISPKSFVIVSGNSGGTYYYVCTGMAKVIADKLPQLKASVETSTGAPLENNNFVNGSAETLGMATMDGVLKAIVGDKEAGYRKPLTKLRVLMGGHTQICYIAALASGPKNFAEFKGKKLGTLSKGASIRAQLEAILAEYNLFADKGDVRLVPMSYTEQVDALKDNNLDVITSGGGIPQASIMDISTSHAIRLINIDKSLQAKLEKKHPYWTFGTIPAGTYKGQDTDVTVVQSQILLMGNEDLSEEFVYNLIKTLFDNNATIAAVHPEGKNWGYENTAKLYAAKPDLPWHPGVKKLLEERKAKK